MGSLEKVVNRYEVCLCLFFMFCANKISYGKYTGQAQTIHSRNHHTGLQLALTGTPWALRYSMSCSTRSNFKVNKQWSFSIAVTHCPLTPFRYYISATSKVLAIIDDGVQNRVMKNGETLYAAGAEDSDDERTFLCMRYYCYWHFYWPCFLQKSPTQCHIHIHSHSLVTVTLSPLSSAFAALTLIWLSWTGERVHPQQPVTL